MQLNSLFSFLGKGPAATDADANANAAQASSGFGAMFASTLAMLAHRPAGSESGSEAANGANSPDVEGHFEFAEASATAADAGGTTSDMGGTAADVLSTATGGPEDSGEGAPDEAATIAKNGYGDGAAATALGAGEASVRADVASVDGETNPNDHSTRKAEGSTLKDTLGTRYAAGLSGDSAGDRRTSYQISRAASVDSDSAVPPAVDAESRGTSSAADTSSELANTGSSTSGGDASLLRSADAVRSTLVDWRAAGDDPGQAAADVSSKSRAAASTNAANSSADSASRSPNGAADIAPKRTSNHDAAATAPRRESDHVASAEAADHRVADTDGVSAAARPGRSNGAAADNRTNQASTNAANSELEPSARPATGALEPSGAIATASSSEAAENQGKSTGASGETGRSVGASPASADASGHADRLRAAELERSARRHGAERTGVWTESSTRSTSGETAPSPTAAAEGKGSEPQIPASATADVYHETQPKSAVATAETPNVDSAADAEAAILSARPEAAREESTSDDKGARRADRELTAAKERQPAANTGGDSTGDFASRFDGEAADAFDQAAEDLSPDIIEFDDVLEAREASLESETPVEGRRTESAHEPVITSERSSSPTASTHAAAAERAARPRHGTAAQWMQTLLKDGLDGFSFDEEWKVLEMKLEEGQGTMTVRARRDEEKVSITVNFSDPQLRALAADQADRLQETLRAQYQSDVDFSLMSDNAGQSPADGRQSQSGGGSDANGGATGRNQPLSGADRARATRAALAGARNEWIG